MNLYDLRDARFESLGTAVGDWDAMVKKLQALEKDARQGLKGLAEKADWKGVNASVTKEFIGRTAKEFDDAHTEATTVRNILKSTHDELVSYQKQLHDALADADRQNLWVSCSGDQIIVTSKQSGPNGPTLTTDDDDNIQAMLTRVQGIMKNAGESDSSAAKVLDELMKQKPYGFSSAKYKDRDSAARAVEDAERLARLMKKGDDMSPEELKELNRILARDRDDPLFQERFAESVGPKGLLHFWMDLSDPTDHGPLQKLRNSGQFAELQKNLGMVLAGATQSDSPAMQKWESDIVKSGYEKFHTGRSTVYGFQLMSNLMRTGNWNDQFLDDYGNALVATEKKTGRPDVIWGSNMGKGLPITMNFIGPDNGRDPMAGVMHAMSNSPDESAHFFSNKANAQWVLKDRPVFDTTPQNMHDGNQTVEAAGRAVIAATTGANPNDPNAHPGPHSPENQTAFRNALSVLAQADDKMHPELRDDMAVALVDHGSEFVQSVGTRTIAGDQLSESDLRVLTKQIAKDGHAFRILDNGMYGAISHDITTSHDPSTGDSLIRAGAVFGFMEESRNQAIESDKPSESWLTQYAAPVGVSVVSDLMPKGGNTFSTLAGIGVDAWKDHNQQGVDEQTMAQIRQAYDERNHRTDDFARLWDQAHPGDPSRTRALEDMESAVTNSKIRVQSGWGQD